MTTISAPAEAAPAVVDQLHARSTARDLVASAVASSFNTLVARDPGLRTGGDVEDVHQARIATRRLRSDLRTMRPLLVRDWVANARAELKWLASVLGEVRDADVLLAELAATGSQLPDPDQVAVAALLEVLQVERARAQSRLLGALESERYRALLATLASAAIVPPLDPADPRGMEAADRVLPGLVATQWKRLRRSVERLGDGPSDEALHEVRKRAKQLRYASETASPVVGSKATRLAGKAKAVQDVLGEVHDAVVAQAWLRRAGIVYSEVAGPSLPLASGQMIEQQRRRADRYRKAWPKSWKRARRKKARAWLSN